MSSLYKDMGIIKKKRKNTIPAYELGTPKKKVHVAAGLACLCALSGALTIGAMQATGEFEDINEQGLLTDPLIDIVTGNSNASEEYLLEKFEDTLTELDDLKTQLENLKAELNNKASSESVDNSIKALDVIVSYPAKIDLLKSSLTNMDLKLKDGTELVNLEDEINKLTNILSDFNKDMLEIDLASLNGIEGLKATLTSLEQTFSNLSQKVYNLKVRLALDKTFIKHFSEVNQQYTNSNGVENVTIFYSPTGEYAMQYDTQHYQVIHDGIVFDKRGNEESIRDYNSDSFVYNGLSQLVVDSTAITAEEDSITLTTKNNASVTFNIDNKNFINEYQISGEYNSNGTVKTITRTDYNNAKENCMQNFNIVNNYNNLTKALNNTYSQPYLKIDMQLSLQQQNPYYEHSLALLGDNKFATATVECDSKFNKVENNSEEYSVYSGNNGVIETYYTDTKTDSGVNGGAETLSEYAQQAIKNKTDFVSFRNSSYLGLNNITYSATENTFVLSFVKNNTKTSKTYVVDNNKVIEIKVDVNNQNNKYTSTTTYKHTELSKEEFNKQFNKIETKLNELKDCMQQNSNFNA